jgi:hypothetical protein
MIKFRGLTVGGVMSLCVIGGCANFSGVSGSARLSDDFSYYEPFDNAGALGPDFLVGPPPPRPDVHRQMSTADLADSLPSIPDRSLPRSCLSCD